jgi:DNA polymerase IV
MDNKWRKIILHVDMDAFFASVEQLLNPEWIGQPVIVGADPQDGKGRGVVAAASYEARKYGVHSAMPISRAYQLCPKGVYVQPHGHLYQHYSQQVFNILSGYSPLVEPLSIDEAFLDMTGSLHLYKSLKAIGEKLKNEIKQETHLPASVGIAPSKSVAKIASDLNKPDALVIVEPDKVQDFLDPLPVTKLWGIGEKTFDSLLKMGIRTVYQLRQYPQEVLIQKFGKMGQHILNMATGTDQREVVPTEEVKSVSNEITFDEDQTDMDLVKKTVFNLSEKVAGRLRRSGIQGKTVQLKIRFQDFKTYTRSYSFKSNTNLTDEIYKTTLFLLDEFDPLEIPVRLLGVGVSNLENESGRQLSLWEFDIDKKLKVEKVMDQIQDKFGKNSISHAEGLSHKSKNKN